jgi:hypothetical protein
MRGNEETFDRYIVEKTATDAGRMDRRECPLCRDSVLDPSGMRPTIFLTHLTVDKPEHGPLNALCICGHTGLCHSDSAEAGIGRGGCSFSSSCACERFRVAQ